MFIVVNDGPDRLEDKAFRKYLYNGQTVVADPTPTEFGEAAIISAPNANLARDLVDRYSSAWIGAKAFDTLEEAEARIKEL